MNTSAAIYKQPIWRKCLEFLHVLLYFTPFIFYMFHIFVLQIFCYYFTSSSQFRKINKILMDASNVYIVYFFEFWANIQIKLYIEPEVLKQYLGKENALLIPNHRYDIDLFSHLLLAYKSPIKSNIRGFAKEEIANVPIVGTIFRKIGNVLLKRSFLKDEVVIKEEINNLCAFEDPLWALLYPEGTRFTQARHLASQVFAGKHNRQSYRYHLVPRTKGFCTVINFIRGHFRAMYDIQIAIEGKNDDIGTIAGAFRGVLGGNKAQIIHIMIDRRPMVEVPQCKEGQHVYLTHLFEKKDILMDTFYRTGSFTTDSNKLKPISLEKEWYVLTSVFATSIPVNLWVWIYIYKLINSGQILWGVFLVSVLLTVTFGMRWTLLKVLGPSETCLTQSTPKKFENSTSKRTNLKQT